MAKLHAGESIASGKGASASPRSPSPRSLKLAQLEQENQSLEEAVANRDAQLATLRGVMSKMTVSQDDVLDKSSLQQELREKEASLEEAQREIAEAHEAVAQATRRQRWSS